MIAQVGSSRFLIRKAEHSSFASNGGAVKCEVRLMRSIEAFRVNGWDLDGWAVKPHLHNSEDELLDLAGNAFSGYHVTPLFAALMSTLGLFTADTEKGAEEAVAVSVSSPCNSCSDSDSS